MRWRYAGVRGADPEVGGKSFRLMDLNRALTACQTACHTLLGLPAAWYCSEYNAVRRATVSVQTMSRPLRRARSLSEIISPISSDPAIQPYLAHQEDSDVRQRMALHPILQSARNDDIMSATLKAWCALYDLHEPQREARQRILDEIEKQEEDARRKVAETPWTGNTPPNPTRSTISLEGGRIVKYGWSVHVREALAMKIVRYHRPALPVPDVEAYFTSKAKGYLIMKKLPGLTLTECLPSMRPEQLSSFAYQLGNVMNEIHSIPCPPWSKMGDLWTGRAYHNQNFVPPPARSLASPAEFHRYWCARWLWDNREFACQLEQLGEWVQPPQMPTSVVFGHGDLGDGNVLIEMRETENEVRIVGALDWATAACYPRWFELVMAIVLFKRTSKVTAEQTTTFIKSLLLTVTFGDKISGVLENYADRVIDILAANR
ncbi:hypothetical protein CALVIDRAFT_372332 [Calocera viscosa TUFC12733]|uniref:Aminoglycoside phosphotransferase domain-containing protein n=1 Tax=Calocera viscosa (strain TUFC12733) TaxID=1330018 RepID=A0A167GT85_CALVF|nr:hypothetical protein CALVIDRAFT_372332 [Calocera viscosa TUFC12733]